MSSQSYHYTTQYSSYSQYYSQPTSSSSGSGSSTSKSHSHHHSSSSSSSTVEDWKSYYNNNASWKTPTTIDDNDLTFDGKPLNLLHEENQNRAWSGGEGKKRGRSRVKK